MVRKLIFRSGESNFEKSEKNQFFGDRFNRSSMNQKKKKTGPLGATIERVC